VEDSFVSEPEIRERLALELRPGSDLADPHATARYYRAGAYPGRIGFISPVSNSFCSDCNRLRLTSTGELVGCLFSRKRADITSILDGKCEIEQKIDYIKGLVMAPDFRGLSYDKASAYKPDMVSVGG